MAKVMHASKNVVQVTLDRQEVETLRYHCQREQLSLDEGMEDIIELAMGRKLLEIRKEEEQASETHIEDSLTIMLHVMYPKSGPLSTFDGTDKGMVAALLLETLDVAVHTVMHSKRMEEMLHVMERKNEGMGSGESAIPQHGRSSNHVHSGGGPGSVEGQVQGQGTGPDRVPDSDG